MIKEAAIRYFEANLSVIPVKEDKKPSVAWKRYQQELVPPNGNFENIGRLGLVCGMVSKNKNNAGLEMIDLDIKYDLTGTLFKDYKLLIKDNAPDLLKKLVVQKTVNNGYHFIYRCKKIEGNLKLANRPTTEEERKDNPNDKVRVLIETRGEGGYFVVFPSPNYEVVYGDLCKINEITPEERDILHDCARSFNYDVPKDTFKSDIEYNLHQSDELSPFEDYSLRGDAFGLLADCGWTYKYKTAKGYQFLRPNGTQSSSGSWSEELRRFYVFTTSTQFDSNKAYRLSTVAAILKFNGDFSKCSHWLISEGYGVKKTKETKKVEEPRIEVKGNDFLVLPDESNLYIEQVRNGTYPMGVSTGIPKLDPHWLHKRGQLNVINGHDNSGKTVVLLYLAILSAIEHNWNWVLYSAENKAGFLKRKLIEFKLCSNIHNARQVDVDSATKWIDEHFRFVRTNAMYTYKDVLEIGDELQKRQEFQSMLIDPYNGLFMPDGVQNRHEWDYRVTSEMRMFNTKHNCTIFLNTHAVTEALRRKYPKESVYSGYPMPPEKADTEGGGKFANRADDFLTIHRLTQHPTDWMYTDIHVRKVKEQESGGKTTFAESPVRLRSILGVVGFEDEDGYNPITKRTFAHVEVMNERKPIASKQIELPQQLNPKEEDEEERDYVPF